MQDQLNVRILGTVVLGIFLDVDPIRATLFISNIFIILHLKVCNVVVLMVRYNQSDLHVAN